MAKKAKSIEVIVEAEDTEAEPTKPWYETDDGETQVDAPSNPPRTKNKEKEMKKSSTKSSGKQKAVKSAKTEVKRGRSSKITPDTKLIAGNKECRESGHYGKIKKVFSKAKTLANGLDDLLTELEPPRSKKFKGNEETWVKNYLTAAVRRGFLKLA